jgi:hypothetical protein
MSEVNVTASRLPKQPPVYLTSQPAADIVGITRPTIIKNLPPDAVYVSTSGTRTWPLWKRETVEAFRASYWADRQGGAR